MSELEVILDIIIVSILLFMSVLMLAVFIQRHSMLKRLNVERFSSETALSIQATKGLNLISIVASNAPYVGLLGTVFGILITFYNMGQSGAIEASEIMVGLALALRATAFGLLVAIPATILYTISLRKAEVKVAEWKVLNGSDDAK
ncbi:MAG: TonB-system energizer ExbB [Pseudomonadota bacterium]|nr:TonB-system energizer ExbB [Pseudomonadota bacterium]